MKKYLIALATLAVLAAVCVAVACHIFFSAATTTSQIVYISSKDLQSLGYDKVKDSLLMPHISNHVAFDMYATRLDLAKSIKPGRYQIHEGQNVVDIVRMLKLGLQSPIRLTFNNIRTPAQLAGRIAEQIEADSMEVVSVLSAEEVLDKIGVKTTNELISIFIPNTYEIYWTTSPVRLVERMKREYDSFWNNERETKRKGLNLSRLEVSTLASIVYEETAREDEMARVAGVYVNRLKRGMKLQADPTVKYAMGDFELKRILHKHLKYDSPYNTYMYAGLPPSPIAMASIVAIDAVLNYERHNYLFFCARPEFDGYHNFAQTLRQHNANSRAYSAELNRRKIK